MTPEILFPYSGWPAKGAGLSLRDLFGTFAGRADGTRHPADLGFAQIMSDLALVCPVNKTPFIVSVIKVGLRRDYEVYRAALTRLGSE
jgi:hypothetical protein